MLSRVADSIFWMSRYMERSTSLLRVVRTHYIASQDDMKHFNWSSLIDSYSVHEYTAPSLPTAPRPVLQYLILERDNVASVINNVTRARENARAIQDNITKEVWQCLNDYYHLVRERSLCFQISDGDPVTALDPLIRQSMLFHGTVDITMAREEGFNFLNIGKFLERATQSIVLLLWKLSGGFEQEESGNTADWRFLLVSLSGYELYLKTYRGAVQPDLVVEQVLHNSAFPHSVLYCLRRLHRYFEQLQSESVEESYQYMDFQIGKTMNLVRYCTLANISKEQLKKLLEKIQEELFIIGNGFNEYYFGLNN
jgi:uncharacterized alpha-E superfamily protein